MSNKYMENKETMHGDYFFCFIYATLFSGGNKVPLLNQEKHKKIEDKESTKKVKREDRN